jgi:RimJ/RimL family protein N-acetyltransferase
VTEVLIEPWTDADFGLLRRLLGDPAMMVHLGGPESEEKLAERQARYVAMESGCFRVVADGQAVGWVGVWDREPADGPEAEVGWSVVIEAQGHGIASRATALLLDYARSVARWRWAHAYPSIDNGPSNAICHKLGFELVDTEELEWPPGTGRKVRCNDWRISIA